MSTKWFSDSVIANGIKIHYHRTGGDKPPVVLAHGITDNGLCWTRLAQVLEQDYDLIMFDARGHGLSDVPDRGYGPEEHAADLIGLVRALGLERPALIGHSMGAANVAVAAATASDPSTGAASQLARCVVLEDPPWMQVVSIEAATARAEEWRAQIVRRKSQTQEEIMAEGRTERPEWAEVEWEPWASSKQQVSPQVLDWIPTRMAGTLWQEVVRRITCPMLVITGDPELGAIVTPEIAQEVVNLCPNARVVHIEGAGHSIRRERFEQYVDAVRAFLSDA